MPPKAKPQKKMEAEGAEEEKTAAGLGQVLAAMEGLRLDMAEVQRRIGRVEGTGGVGSDDEGGGEGRGETVKAFAVAKLWSRWVEYVETGETEAAAVGRIDILLQEVRLQFELAKLPRGGIMEALAGEALTGIASLLEQVVKGGAEPEAVATALACFGRQLTLVQRVQSHSADSAAAMAAAMREEVSVEPVVTRASGALAARLQVPRWRTTKDARRADRWQHSVAGRGRQEKRRRVMENKSGGFRGAGGAVESAGRGSVTEPRTAPPPPPLLRMGNGGRGGGRS